MLEELHPCAFWGTSMLAGEKGVPLRLFVATAGSKLTGRSVAVRSNDSASFALSFGKCCRSGTLVPVLKFCLGSAANLARDWCARTQAVAPVDIAGTARFQITSAFYVGKCAIYRGVQTLSPLRKRGEASWAKRSARLRLSRGSRMYGHPSSGRVTGQTTTACLIGATSTLLPPWRYHLWPSRKLFLKEISKHPSNRCPSD